MSKEREIVSLVNRLNELIFDDVLDTDEALMFKIKAIRLLMQADRCQAEVIFNCIDEYLK